MYVVGIKKNRPMRLLKTHVQIDGYESNHNFKLKKFAYLDLYIKVYRLNSLLIHRSR